MFRWQNIMRFVNKETLLEEHEKQSRRKATGVDGVTKDEYEAVFKIFCKRTNCDAQKIPGA